MRSSDSCLPRVSLRYTVVRETLFLTANAHWFPVSHTHTHMHALNMLVFTCWTEVRQDKDLRIRQQERWAALDTPWIVQGQKKCIFKTQALVKGFPVSLCSCSGMPDVIPDDLWISLLLRLVVSLWSHLSELIQKENNEVLLTFVLCRGWLLYARKKACCISLCGDASSVRLSHY